MSHLLAVLSLILSLGAAVETSDSAASLDPWG